MSFRVQQQGNTFRILVGDRLFAQCVYEPRFIRPFLGPVLSSDGASFTRCEEKAEKHPHQRSVFIGVGDVNGVDFWNEERGNRGKMTLQSVLQAQGGETAVVSVRLLWSSVDTGEKIVDEIRTFRFEERDDCIAVHHTSEFIACYGPVTFGQTKEAGPLGVRVSDPLRVTSGGTFCNSEGGVNEEGCWGKDAKWCNYYGDAGGKTIGIACYDRRSNRHYPTAWHIRDYGLMAANNLLFKGEEQIPEGESLTYSYLICFWEDSFDPAKYAD